MSRDHRIVVPDLPHHITQRGNGRQEVFIDDEDRRCYLNWLRIEGKASGVTFLAFCLMTNHVHLVAIPAHELSLAIGIGRAQWGYSRAFHRRHGKSGALWQARFFSCPMDEPHMYQAIRYVELNPVRCGMAKEAGQYAWSSAAEHLGQSNGPRVLELAKLGDQWGHENWSEYLHGPCEEDRNAIRLNTCRGLRWESAPDASATQV